MSAGLQRDDDSAGLTVEQMQDAYHLARKPDWLPLHDMLLQVQRFKLLVGLARRCARGDRPAAAEVASITAPEPPRRHSGAPPLPHHQPQLDFKSRAAGERPERD